MKALTERKAGISSELLYNAWQPTINDESAIERVDKGFYESYAKLAERALAGSHEEDILALQAIENAYCGSAIALSILMKVLFLKENATDELLACAKRCLSAEEYLFLMELLKGFTRLPKGTETVSPSPSEP